MAPVRHFLSRHWLLLSLLLLPLAVLAVCEIAGWPFLRGPVERLLARQAERPVRIAEPFRLHLLGSVRLRAGGLWIAAPAAFDVPHFLDAQDIRLKLGYRDLLHFRRSGFLRIAVLEVERMDVRLLRNRQGDATWRFGPRTPHQEPPELPRVSLLRVGRGSLVFRDPGLDADLRAVFYTREGDASTDPTAHVEVKGQFRERPLQGELSTNGWLPAARQSGGAPPLPAKGWLAYGGVRADFDGEVKDLLGRRGIKGAVAVRGPSLGLVGQLLGSPLPTTPAFTLQGRIEKELDVWQVQVNQAHIGRSDLSAQVTYDPGRDPPRLDGRLTGSNLVLADLGPAFGTRNEEGKPVPPRPGHVLPHRRLNLPVLKNLDARITIDLDRVDLGQAFKEPIRPFKAILTLDGGQLGLAKVDAHTAKGSLSGDISVDARTETPRWHSELAWKGIHLQDWLKSARAGAKAGKGADDAPATPYFTGILQGKADLTGTGRSTAEILGSLDGEITMFVREATLSHLVIEVLGLDVAQGLGLVLKGDEPLPVRCAVMDLGAKNGTIEPKVALVDTPVTLILADGSINLAKERLNLRLTAKPKNVSPFTVRSPIRVQGPFVDPTATPESGPIAARVLGSVALAFVNPLAAIIPFIDPGGAEGSPCARALSTLRH